MSPAFKRLLVAIPFGFVLVGVLGYAAIVAWNPVLKPTVKKEGDKEVTVLEQVGHHFQHLDFWVPVAFAVMVLGLLGVMVYVSSGSSRMTTRVAVGMAATVALVALAHMILRSATGSLAWQGARFAGAFAVGLALLWIYGAIAARFQHQ